MAERNISILNRSLHPYPLSCEWLEGRRVLMDDNAEINLYTTAVFNPASLCKRYRQYRPAVRK